MHVHVISPDGEAKFWVKPRVQVAACYGLSAKQMKVIQKIIEEHKNEIEKAWKKHFES